MTVAVLDSNGLTVPRLPEIKADLEAKAIELFGEDVDLEEDGPMGQLIGIMSQGFDDLYQLLRAVYDSFNPDTAQGQALDSIAAVVGLTREPSAPTTGLPTASGVAGTSIAAGKLIRSTLDGSTFFTTQTVVIPGVPPATGTVDLPVQAEEDGPILVPDTTPLEIVTPVAGWDSVATNGDFDPGQNAESDADLRIRRQESLQAIGNATDGSIRANIVEKPFVDQCLVISNRTLVTDSLGIPGKSFRTVVWPVLALPEEQEEVALEIFNRMPAGIYPDGTERFLITDDEGYSQDVGFSYATEVAIGMEVDLTVDPFLFPSGGEALVKADLLTIFTGLTEEAAAVDPGLFEIVGTGLSMGGDVVVLQINCVAARTPGVRSMVVRMDKKSVVFPPVTVNTDIPIELTEIATLADADLTVAVV